MIRINDIIDKLTEHDPETDTDNVERAFVYSARVHKGQVRLSGEPYLSHPLEVAGILSDMKLDTVSVAAGLLHDVIEDTHTSPVELERLFGSEVSNIVSGVTKLSILPVGDSQTRQAESIRKTLLAMADDIRVILIKLADRLHNMRTLQYHRKESKRRQIAQETLDIYAPIAARLGIYWLKNELEDISFQYLKPDEFAEMERLVSKEKSERENYIETVKGYIKEKLTESSLKCEVLGRNKHYYSIHQKMVHQNLAFEEVYDITAFRIILDTIPQCYEALGLIHSLWKPVPKKFKDYIGVPKPNMYQSLHTTVIGLKGERIEIQIRTWEMDGIAKSGIAAHWSYKEGKRIDEDIKRFAWIQSIVENHENIKDPKEFLENVRIDLFPDEAYVFTPRGDVKSVPRGATPVDFAYLIHSEVGNQCVGAKVNGQIVPLQYELKTGDTVEVITSKNHHPSKDWLNFVKTVKAKSKIRHWIKTQEKSRSMSLGREMCEKAFRKHRLNFNTLAKSEKMAEVIDHFGFKAVEDLIASVGYGKNTPLQILQRFMPKPEPQDENESILNKIMGRVRKKKPGAGVLVKGVDDILIKFGKCCEPVPGDYITGYITRGYGVTVHRTGCVNALKMNPERQVEVEWDEVLTETYPLKIRVNSVDRVGLLADVASNISKNGANILAANTQTREDDTVDSLFTISVEGTDHLNRVLLSIRKVKGVQSVRRIEG